MVIFRGHYRGRKSPRDPYSRDPYSRASDPYSRDPYARGRDPYGSRPPSDNYRARSMSPHGGQHYGTDTYRDRRLSEERRISAVNAARRLSNDQHDRMMSRNEELNRFAYY